jgi:hypothetical protein
MRRTILLVSVLPFVSAFLGGALAFTLVAAPQATAQSSQLQEVRASAFTLVGEDGTVLARLAPGPGGGRFSLRNAAGTERVTLAAAGILNVWDQDGTTVVFRAGRSYNPVGAATGLPPINGVELGPDGSIGMLESR